LLIDIITTQGEIMGILVGRKALGFTAPPVLADGGNTGYPNK
jgi:hypothetical protein